MQNVSGDLQGRKNVYLLCRNIMTVN